MTGMADQFAWKPEYAIGIHSIDSQHRNLFAMFDELNQAMNEGQGNHRRMRRTLEWLVQYTKVHFAHEERLMLMQNYPGFRPHKTQHDALTRKVLALQNDYVEGKANMTGELVDFLKNWLVRHIQNTDARMAQALKSKEVA
jgi:hemerythrin